MTLRLAVLALALASGSSTLFSNDTEHMRYQFDEYKASYGKSYKSASEEAHRLSVFAYNMKVADARNAAEQAAGGSAIHGVTRFSDLTQDEFAARYLLSVPPTSSSKKSVSDVKPLPEGVHAAQDWSGVYTTPVKNQGYCGSCWAFSAVEQIESDAMRTLGDSYILSPQQVVSCDNLRSEGCNGGWSEDAYNYVQQAGGIVQESDYPYSTASSEFGISGTCQSSECANKVVTVDSYSTISGESSMASYVESTGPLSVCLDASSWNSYTGGVMSTCGNSVDHCVQAVGVDTGNGYWKVRNSWGSSWGESGYIFLKYGSNTCDITNDPTYVTVSNVNSEPEKPMKLTWSDCSTGSDIGSVTSFTGTPVLGSPFTISGSVSATGTVSSGTVSLTGTYQTLPVINNQLDLCSGSTYALPLGAGTVTWPGVSCPAGSEDIGFTLDLTMSGIYDITVAVDGYFCVNVGFTL